MPDIFGRNPSPFAGAFAADASLLIFNGENQALALIQQLSINYSQPVNTIFEIGSNNRYYVVGRTTGQVMFGRIVGPVITSGALLAVLGNVCAQGDRNLFFVLGNAACQGSGAGRVVKLFAQAVVAQSVGYSMQAEQMLINEQVQCICGQLDRIDV
jgi:hypothetical protein